MDLQTLILLAIAASGAVAVGTVLFKILAIIALIRAWAKTAAMVSLVSATGLGAALLNADEESWMWRIAGLVMSASAEAKGKE